MNFPLLVGIKERNAFFIHYVVITLFCNNGVLTVTVLVTGHNYPKPGGVCHPKLEECDKK